MALIRFSSGHLVFLPVIFLIGVVLLHVVFLHRISLGDLLVFLGVPLSLIVLHLRIVLLYRVVLHGVLSEGGHRCSDSIPTGESVGAANISLRHASLRLPLTAFALLPSAAARCKVKPGNQSIRRNDTRGAATGVKKRTKK